MSISPNARIELAAEVQEAAPIAQEEHAFEESLLALLDEERLRYVDSMVLGLNDALLLSRKAFQAALCGDGEP